MTTEIEYNWIGINELGKKTSGSILAHNKADVIQKLASTNITTIRINKKNKLGNLFQQKHFSLQSKLDFTQQLHLLLEAGIPLTDALSLISEHTSFQITRDICIKIREKIISGDTFSNTLKHFSEFFDTTYQQMIMAGEQSDQLNFCLSQLIYDQEQQLNTKNKIIKTLSYPVIVLCITLLITLGMLIFVIPSFKSIYSSFGAQLPHATTILIQLSNEMIKHAISIVSLILLTATAMISIFKNPFFKESAYKLLLMLPLYRTIYITKLIANWSRLMSIMLSTGIPIIEALEIANQVITQPILQKQMRMVQNKVITGHALHTSLNAFIHFPKRAIHLISIGENADALDSIMTRLAIIYQKQFENSLDHLSKILEPVIMIGIASLISGLIIAMYLPIFRMGNIL